MDQLDISQTLLDSFEGIIHLRSLIASLVRKNGTVGWKTETGYALTNGGVAIIDCDLHDPDLVHILSKCEDFAFIVNRQDQHNGGWKPLLNQRWRNVEKRIRFAFSSKDLSIERLQTSQKEVPEGFHMRKLGPSDQDLLTKEFQGTPMLILGTVDNIFERTTTFGVIDNETNKLVAMCMGYPLIGNEEEIDILTSDDEKYRRKGLGSIASRAFMVDALSRGKIPVWDAAHEISRDMALKLGFTDPVAYYTYFCSN